AIHRPDRAERLAAAPGGEIEILAVRSAGGEHLGAHLVAHAEQRIDAGEGARTRADREVGRERETIGDRLVEAALPIAAVAAAREHDRVEHARHARPCAGHPRLRAPAQTKTWMAGTSPAMTVRNGPNTDYARAVPRAAGGTSPATDRVHGRWL